MTGHSTRQNRITCILLLLAFCGVLLRNQVDLQRQSNLHLLYGILQTCLWCGLIAVWCMLMRHRVIQSEIRKYLSAMCAFMIFWFLVRGLKYYVFPPETDAARYCWYSYYVPMMFYPVCAVLAMMFIGKREGWEPPKYAAAIFLPPVFISLLVLTNDLHQKVFVFPEEARVWSDVQYEYGVLYALSFVFFLGCTIATLVIMIRRCRIPQTCRIYAKIPLLPPFLGLCYSIAYAGGHASFFSDLIIVMCFLTVCTFESAIRLGYIRSNTNYRDIFYQSSIAAQIYDRDMQIRYAGRDFLPYEDEILQNTIRLGEYRQDNMRYVAKNIRGGYVVWREDVTELTRLHRELESANEYLEGQNLLLRQNYEARLQRSKLEEQNQLYNKIQHQTKEKLVKVDQLLRDFGSVSREQETDLLMKIGILTAYLKRRNNLIFLAESDQRIPFAELENCMKETARMLELFGLICVTRVETDVDLFFGQMTTLYDAFELAVEETAERHPAYFVTVAREKQSFVLRIRIEGVDRIPESLQAVFETAEQEEGLLLLKKCVEEGEV